MQLQIMYAPLSLSLYWIYKLSSSSDGEINRVTAWNVNGKSQLLRHL